MTFSVLAKVEVCLFFSSRQMTALWEERKNQVKLEEHRQNTKGSSKMTSRDLKATFKIDVNRLVLREVWVECAEYLISQTKFQEARMLLEEASLSAVAFDDRKTQNYIDCLYAVLALHQRKWGKVVSFVENEQRYPCDQILWLQKISLQISGLHNFSIPKTTFQFHPTKLGYEACKEVLVKSMKTIEELSTNKKNSYCSADYVRACLQHALGKVLYKHTEELDNIDDLSVTLHEAAQHLEQSFQQMNKLGYQYKALEVIKPLVEIQRQFAFREADVTEKKRICLKTYRLSKTALENINALAEESEELFLLEDITNVFLPVKLEQVKIQSLSVDVMIDMIEIALQEKKDNRIEEEKKEYIVKVKGFVCR